jgi:hypothetical protein
VQLCVCAACIEQSIGRARLHDGFRIILVLSDFIVVAMLSLRMFRVSFASTSFIWTHFALHTSVASSLPNPPLVMAWGSQVSRSRSSLACLLAGDEHVVPDTLPTVPRLGALSDFATMVSPRSRPISRLRRRRRCPASRSRRLGSTMLPRESLGVGDLAAPEATMALDRRQAQSTKSSQEKCACRG